MKEIEILIEVKSTKEQALAVLKQFEFKGLKKTLDIYIYDPLRKDLQPDKYGRLKNCARLRQKDGKNFFAYKIDYFNEGEWSYSDEYETGIDDFEIMNKSIKLLGLLELVRIDNEKHVFMTPDYEIVLEEVKNLGLYIEVEKLSQVPDDKISETKEEIRSFLKSLNIKLGEEQNAGKPELMLKKINEMQTLRF
jgi:adenylate cyclase class 2